jgi:hypothetical protein
VVGKDKDDPLRGQVRMKDEETAEIRTRDVGTGANPVLSAAAKSAGPRPAIRAFNAKDAKVRKGTQRKN